MKAIKNYKGGGALDLTPSGKTKRRLNQATRKALRATKQAARDKEKAARDKEKAEEKAAREKARAEEKAARDKEKAEKKAARKSNVPDIVAAGVPGNPRFMIGQVTRKNGVAPTKPDPPKKEKGKILNNVGSRPDRTKPQRRVRIPASCRNGYCP
mgnify:CR=1 FL=1